MTDDFDPRTAVWTAGSGQLFQMTPLEAPAAPAPIVFLDTETDGTHDGRRPWEIAMIRRTGDTEQRISIFVDIKSTTSDHRGLQIGGFYDRHPMGRFLAGIDSVEPDPRKAFKLAGTPVSHLTGYVPDWYAAQVVAQWTHGAQIWGAVPNFDAETLAPMLRAEKIAPAWKHRVRCVETLTAGHLGREVGGLAACAEALGIEFAEADLNTALGDAVLAMRIHDAIIRPAVAA